MKRITNKVVYVLFLVVAGLVLTELLARYMFPEYRDDEKYLKMAFDRLCNSGVIFDSPTENSPDDNCSRKFGFCLSPNAERKFTAPEFSYVARTNSLGFRTNEVQPKTHNEYRVLLLGDSTFWGVGVNRTDMISTRIEDLGRADTAIPLSVYNYSVSGYNTVQELIVAQTYIHELQPDYVILGLFIGNDIIPNALAFIDPQGNYAVYHEKIERMQSEIIARGSVFYHSIVFRTVALPVYIPRLRYQLAVSDEIIQHTYDLLRDFDKLMKEQGIRFAVVVIYPRDAVQGGLVEKWSQSRRVGNLLHQFCREHGITSLNLLDVMSGRESKNRYFFQDDGHFNQEGNHFLGQVIFQHLIATQLKEDPRE